MRLTTIKIWSPKKRWLRVRYPRQNFCKIKFVSQGSNKSVLSIVLSQIVLYQHLLMEWLLFLPCNFSALKNYLISHYFIYQHPQLHVLPILFIHIPLTQPSILLLDHFESATFFVSRVVFSFPILPLQIWFYLWEVKLFKKSLLNMSLSKPHPKLAISFDGSAVSPVIKQSFLV